MAAGTDAEDIHKKTGSPASVVIDAFDSAF